MPRTEATDDLSTVLFLVPFIVPGLYGLVLWIQSGISLVLPATVYLTVTRDPVTFLIGFFAVIGGVAVDVFTADSSERRTRLSENQGVLQKIAAAAFVLSLILAFYSAGGDVSNTSVDFIVGRYSLVFPALLFLMSYLMVSPFGVHSSQTYGILGAVLLLGVPVAIYEVGKHHTVAGLGLALLLLIAGVALFVLQWARPKPQATQSKKQ